MGKISALRSYKINQLGNITIPTLISSAGNSQNYVFSTTDDIYFEAEIYLNSYYADGNPILEASSTTEDIVNEFSFKVIGTNGEGPTRLLPVGSFGIYNGERGQSLSIHYTDSAIISLNTWTKVTAKRINGIWSLFINDISCSVSRFDDAGVPNNQFGNIELPVYIGRSEVGNFNFDGQIRNTILGNKLINSKISIKKQNLGGGKIKIYKPTNLFTCPFEVDTTTCPSPGLNNSGWLLGPNILRMGRTTAPDNSNSAVIYQSIAAPNCYVSQGFPQYWRPFTRYQFSIWTKLIAGEVGQGNVINVSRNGSTDRAVLPALGNLTSEWKKFTITFTTAGSYNDDFGYTTAFFAENFNGGTQIALWGAEMYRYD